MLTHTAQLQEITIDLPYLSLNRIMSSFLCLVPRKQSALLAACHFYAQISTQLKPLLAIWRHAECLNRIYRVKPIKSVHH